MPIYIYQEILKNGSKGNSFEVFQHMSEPSLKIHPISGNPLKKTYSSPNINIKYNESTFKKKLDPANLKKKGFTKFVRDKNSNKYHKTN